MTTSPKKARTRAQDALLIDRQTGDSQWACCAITCDNAPAMYRHVAAHHDDLLQARIALEMAPSPPAAASPDLEGAAEFTSRRADKYGSDPINLSCQWHILFYLYIPIDNPLALANLHKTWAADLGLSGKVKLAKEGINATLAGSTPSVLTYIDNFTSLPDIKSLGLDRPNDSQSDTDREALKRSRHNFFKPTAGCRHVFGEVMSIKVVEEICPLGAPELSVYNDPENRRGKLAPDAFHHKLKELQGKDDVVILDVRNYYESSIGRFPGAIAPPIRKFSSFRDYIDQNKDQFAGKTILSYCTGGIRCEKATSYLRQSLNSEDTQPAKVYMLDGGIHNYLEWIKQEDSLNDSLWLGKNYVFDARQSLGLEETTGVAEHKDRLISFCQVCNKPCARYVKCDGFGCHRLVIACEVCSPLTLGSKSELHCCQECKIMGEKVQDYVNSGQESGPGSTRIKRGSKNAIRAVNGRSDHQAVLRSIVTKGPPRTHQC
ncbi:thiosulfate sulfurtransferase (rhodanese)-like domain-containing protein 2 [Dissophora globulifera]|nr:thiosulfate sulfurtransferase (rhodanese)-like domain-containing protein 2 [Dissophora globulifera]